MVIFSGGGALNVSFIILEVSIKCLSVAKRCLRTYFIFNVESKFQHLNLQIYKRKWEGKGNVPERLSNQPDFLSSSRTWQSCNATFYFSIFCISRFQNGILRPWQVGSSILPEVLVEHMFVIVKILRL